jgi:trimeric autotransporter adhesin
MSEKYPGGIITKNPTEPTTSVAAGMWTVQQAAAYTKIGLWPRSPGAPSVGTATVSVLTASVPFTAPSDAGSATITNYVATSSPSGIQGTSATSPISVAGLSPATAYTFQVQAINAAGTGSQSVASNSVTTADVPGAPTIGTATAAGLTASVPFTAPASDGGATITSYTATSSPGSVTGTLNQAGSGTITVNGLTSGTAYTFTVTATNAIGTSAASAASNSVTPLLVVGQDAFTTPGTYSWVAPSGVTSVAAVAVGGGGYVSASGVVGGGGGALAYRNGVSVTPLSSYTVVVGGAQSNSTALCMVAGGGQAYEYAACISLRGTGGAPSGTFTGGGSGGFAGSHNNAGGGGGAGGYSGNGGNGALSSASRTGSAGSGGGGGGGGGPNCNNRGGGGGGGVGLLGQGSSGAGGSACGTGATGGGGGSCGAAGGTYTSGNVAGGAGGLYGGGGGSNYNYGVGLAGTGAVRIIWPGTTRSFPSTCTGNL